MVTADAGGDLCLPADNRFPFGCTSMLHMAMTETQLRDKVNRVDAIGRWVREQNDLDRKVRDAGKYTDTEVAGVTVQAFLPYALPPKPELTVTSEMAAQVEAAASEVAKLDAELYESPDGAAIANLLLLAEVVHSSAIEGLRVPVLDLLVAQADIANPSASEHLDEVVRCAAAHQQGLQMLEDGHRVDGRMLREVHRMLMGDNQHPAMTPGEYREVQNWIGGSRPGNARFVPPPPQRVEHCMDDLDRYMNQRQWPADGPTLVQAALAHGQFETIHPFVDGNGRTGRILTSLLLARDKMPMYPLPLSGGFHCYQDAYYGQLDGIRRYGDWERWVDDFLTVAKTSAAVSRAFVRSFNNTVHRDRNLVKARAPNGSRTTILKVHTLLCEQLVANVHTCTKLTGLSRPAATNALCWLSDQGIAPEGTGQKRDRRWDYERLIDLTGRIASASQFATYSATPPG